MQFEGLDLDSFEDQKKNKWKLQGKSFYDIFREVEPEDFYKYLYGFGSESIHGSWNDSMDYNLSRNSDGTFSTYTLYQAVDPRFVTPVLRICHDPYVLWLKRICVEDEYLNKLLSWIQATNGKLFEKFEKLSVSEE